MHTHHRGFIMDTAGSRGPAQRSNQVLGIANALEDSGQSARPSGDPSVSSSLEHLIAGSQGVITTRVDLALLEARELLSRFIERAALAGLAILLAAGAWFAAAAALTLFVATNADPALRLAVFGLTGFGLINAAGAFGLIMLAQRQSPPFAAASRHADGRTPAHEPSRTGAGN